MRFYSKLKINLLSIIISIIICFFIFSYIPQFFKVTKSYIYYKNQPDLEKEYEE